MIIPKTYHPQENSWFPSAPSRRSATSPDLDATNDRRAVDQPRWTRRAEDPRPHRRPDRMREAPAGTTSRVRTDVLEQLQNPVPTTHEVYAMLSRR
ncbi:hypothetical protein V2I01_31975 [Micromonospora sp. BRA006-A]|nr:hypothetical protein [Micromonospora sp. BRA006-A]